MKLHLTFDSIEKAANANIQIFENYARTKSEVLRTATDELVPVGDIPTGNLVSMIYVVPGVKGGTPLQDGQGQTEKWAEIQEREDQPGTFFFEKPDESLMVGVVFDTEEEPATSWYPAEEI